MAKIVVVGSLSMDVVAVSPRLPQPGETVLGTECFNEPGGKGANQAYAAAKLGGDVAMLGRIGDDYYGRRMLANLASAGCEVDGVKTLACASGVALIVLAETGKPPIVVVPGANALYSPSALRGDERILGTAQCVLLQMEIPLDTVIYAAQLAKRRGALVILDPAPVPEFLPAELLQTIDILTPNETEAARLVGRQPQNLEPEDAREIAKELQSRGAGTVIIRLGAQGCLIAEAGKITKVPARQVNAVDTTAAGDVFNAALAVASCEGVSLVEACQFAVDEAALSVLQVGAQRSMPSRSELKAFLNGAGSQSP